ncbi:TonB-linked SusC/RagA family outer membrane protein [Dysgonomonas alginatilytica]|uniref:TonB-linked SusC/RagA family outer membrane protein n=1 Tax=Dysgonomonas alginatilytica TaxID=1605892 RepID=A0A2V3PMP6_9BACT|nr:TonB-dependent receptor [Dysgonomonas alginatilytica]PXV62006.1 TonB-linked SusC/RagA family outer membrane protein [Dysgonomonas alginatilytica]
MNKRTSICLKQKMALLCMLFFMSALAAFAQNFTANGVITDSSTKETLPGVSVTVRGTTIGTISDPDGKFSLSVPQNGTLVFSYLGYKTFEIKASNGTGNISLEPLSFAIDDVVVVGIRMRKSDLTGAVGSISKEQLQEIPTTDLTTAMQGKVPGLNISRTNAAPGSDISMKIRGTNSISYGTNPVFVIDGIVAEEGLRLINPDEIASIEVLKDASSTALYGSKASNGVVVITTKKGQKGEGKVSYSGFVTTSRYQDRLKTLDAFETMNLRKDAYANAFMDSNPNADRNAYINDFIFGTDKVFSPEELENGKNNRTSDWIDELTRTGIEQNHALNFSGGSDNSTYFLGFSYSNNEGILQKSSYERFNGRINFETKVKPWLKVGTNTSVSRGTKNRLDDNAYETALLGNRLQTIDTDRLYMYFQGVAQMGMYNPILTKSIDSKEIHDRVLTANYIEVNPIKNLYVRSTFSADIYNKQDSKYIPSYVGQSIRDNKNGEGWQWRGQTKYYQWDNSASYEKTFAEKHRIFGLLSSSISKSRSNNISMSGYNYPTDALGYKNMGMASDKEKNNMSSDYKTNTLVSVIARANYSYEYKYLLTATVRRDGSSKFATENKWGTFPSVSAAWTISEEAFMKKADWLNLLKLRVGYGILGNQNIPEYGYLTIYSPTYNNGVIGFVPEDGRFGNSNIKWEKQKQWNLGLDATVWNDRISMSVDVFSMTNSDLLMKMSMWPSFGYSYQIANVAELENKGIEFSFNALLVKSKDFKWNVSGNIAHDKNKITKLYGGVDVLWNGGNTMSRDGNLFVGNPLNTIYGFQVDRLAQESDMAMVNGWTSIYNNLVVKPGDMLPVDLDGDGKITAENDMKILGNTNPKFYGGFSTNLNYKQLTLDAVFVYSYGAKKTDWVYERTMDGTATIGPAHEEMLKRWTPENTNTSIPRAYRGDGKSRFGYGNTSYGLMDASFLRCAALTLTYNFPRELVGKAFEQLSVNASGNNLFLVTPYKGYDPESGQGYPLTRSFTFGLNLTF